ncbi:hypothetical protein FPV67DRAFT_1454917 [Lyophyllum atratum]|nr:hypothetical protein FPV67DRAFT_1454917 [Lyophyllum atratum]
MSDQNWHCECGSTSSLLCMCIFEDQPSYPQRHPSSHPGPSTPTPSQRSFDSALPSYPHGPSSYANTPPGFYTYPDGHGVHQGSPSYFQPYPGQFYAFPGPFTSGHVSPMATDSQRPVLGSSSALNAPRAGSSSNSGKKRKGTANPTTAGPPKRRRTVPTASLPSDTSTSAHSTPARPTVYGVGPSASQVPALTTNSPAITPSPHHTRYHSILAKPQEQRSNQVASDVWYCVRALQSATKPDSLPPTEPTFRERPKNAPYIGCRLCKFPEWRVWKNTLACAHEVPTYLLIGYRSPGSP